MRAAVALVSDRGTTTVPVSDLAEAADVSRQFVYLQFADRDTLLLAAARDLAERELLPCITDGTDPMLAVAQHFAQHRPFYRPMLTGACAFGLNKVLNGILGPYNEQIVLLMSKRTLAPEIVADLTGFVTGGYSALFNSWIIEGPDPLDPASFASRLMQLLPHIVGSAIDADIAAEAHKRRRKR
jgi:AcrR family transcriptional regulator